MTPDQHKWACPYKPCDTIKGPYYSLHELRAASALHIRVQHAHLLAPMHEAHRADARMRHSARTDPGYAPE